MHIREVEVASHQVVYHYIATMRQNSIKSASSLISTPHSIRPVYCKYSYYIYIITVN